MTDLLFTSLCQAIDHVTPVNRADFTGADYHALLDDQVAAALHLIADHIDARGRPYTSDELRDFAEKRDCP